MKKKNIRPHRSSKKGQNCERNPDKDLSENKIESVLDRLRDISEKIERHVGIPTNNIVVNSCKPWMPQQMSNCATQTVPAELNSEQADHPGGQQDGGKDHDHAGCHGPVVQSQHSL